MSNRSPGEGTVFQRQDGRWQASLMADGKRCTVYGTTRKEAADKLAALKSQASGGVLPSPGKRTLADLLALWLETAAPNWKPRTLSDYQRICDTYIVPAIGKVRLSRLEPAQVQRLVAHYQGEGKARTALKVYGALRQACALAVRWRWLPDNPCDRVQRPQYRAQRKDVWTSSELSTFLEGTEGHWLHPLWTMLVCTGCRLGEALALEWADVAGNTVAITKAGQHIRGVWTVTAPKTRAGTRTITLPPEGRQAMSRQRVQQLQWRLKAGPDWHDSGLVFSQQDGRPLQGPDVANAMRKESHRLGLPHVTPHGLRHLHASLLLREGLPLPEVSQRLGHAHSGITASVYSHAISADDSAAVAAIGRALAGSR